MGMLGPPLFTQVFGFAIGTALVGAPYLLASGFLLLALLLSLTIKGNSSTVAQTQSV
jgi:hypothetical protein